MPSREMSEPTDDEAARRRDEVVRRMLATPPQPKPKRVKSPEAEKPKP